MRWCILLIFPLFLFAHVSVVGAVDVTFSTISPVQIFDNEERTVTVQVDTSSSASATLRVAFYQGATSTNYFGCFKDAGSQYYCGNDHSLFPAGAGAGPFTITFKPDTANSAYKGDGDYFVKVGRYTAGGSVTWSEPQLIHITPIATPTPVPTPATPAPTPIPATPTPTPKPTPIPTPKPTPTPSPTPSPTPDVLGTSTSSAIMTTQIYDDSEVELIPTASPAATLKDDFPVMAVVAITLGMASLLGLGGYLWYDWWKSHKVV